MERELVPIFDKCGFGTTVWSPLSGGYLTGKYNKMDPKDGRYTEKKLGMFNDWAKARYIDP